MVKTWLSAKRSASVCESIIFHNYTTGKYGSCPMGQMQGHFERCGHYTTDRCLYLPARWTTDQIEDAEQAHLQQHPLSKEEMSK